MNLPLIGRAASKSTVTPVRYRLFQRLCKDRLHRGCFSMSRIRFVRCSKMRRISEKEAARKKTKLTLDLTKAHSNEYQVEWTNYINYLLNHWLRISWFNDYDSIIRNATRIITNIVMFLVMFDYKLLILPHPVTFLIAYILNCWRLNSKYTEYFNPIIDSHLIIITGSMR